MPGAGKPSNWNFCKYLVGRSGKVVNFHAWKVAPQGKDRREAIQAASLCQRGAA